MAEYRLENLIHPPMVFTRQSLEQRKETYGLNNLSRMELFLWDLELFVHIQRIFGERVVLKGGAAVQFYLPIENQRTSVDIDIIFQGSKQEMDEALITISREFKGENGLFTYEDHKPKTPKTKLPLHTYNFYIPSICNGNELYTNPEGVQKDRQRLKIDMMLSEKRPQISMRTGENIFAVSSKEKFNILPLNALFADKLTTLGPNSIGIQNARVDEQTKQMYDLSMLLKYHSHAMDMQAIGAFYWERAKQECECRGIPFHQSDIATDVHEQLAQWRYMDVFQNKELKKYVNDFKGLYLYKMVDFLPADASIAASQIYFFYRLLIMKSTNLELIRRAFQTAELLRLNRFTGQIKGQVERAIKENLLKHFECPDIKQNILKGKSLVRLYWALVSPNNVMQMAELVNAELDKHQRDSSMDSTA